MVITDRNDLDDQFFDTFFAARNLLRQTPVQADSTTDLEERLSVEAGGVIFTTTAIRPTWLSWLPKRYYGRRKDWRWRLVGDMSLQARRHPDYR